MAITIRFTGETSKMSWGGVTGGAGVYGWAVGEDKAQPLLVGLVE